MRCSIARVPKSLLRVLPMTDLRCLAGAQLNFECTDTGGIQKKNLQHLVAGKYIRSGV
jgi:hypothetical protein